MEVCSPLPKANHECKEGKQRDKSNMKNSRGQQLLDTFQVFTRVHFMHTICRFESREVRSPMLQMVCKLELKWRSYGHLKTTTQSWAKISQLRNELRNEIHLWNFARCFAAVKPPASTHVCHFASWNSIFAAINHVAKSPPSWESSCKSSPSCEITNSTCKIKVQTCKMDNSTCELPCEIHLCNLRYLQPTQLDFFSRYFV